MEKYFYFRLCFILLTNSKVYLQVQKVKSIKVLDYVQQHACVDVGGCSVEC